jgi:hypothetical protein
MDELLKKKEEILNFAQKKFSEGSINQKEIVELSQDLQRANHNIKHIIRGNTNPAGRFSTAAFGGFLGLCWVLTKFPRNSGILLPCVIGILPITVGSYVFYKIGVNRFSSEGDAKKNKAALENSMVIDEQFRELVKSYKKASY